MRILTFIIGKANPDRANGVNQVINGLFKYLGKNNKVDVIGLSKSMSENHQTISREGFEVEVYSSFSDVFEHIKTLSDKIDIVHLHGVWNIYNVRLGKFLRKKGIPYIITVHSGLTEDRIKQSNYLFKILFHKIFQKNLFDKAAGIHALTREEMLCISKYSNNTNIFYIPNGQDLGKVIITPKEYAIKKKVIFGYIGRLSVEKNIDTLIAAIDQLPSSLKEIVECRLIGPVDGYAQKYIDEVKKRRLEKVILFPGPKYGEEKYSALKDLDFYIHPAKSDVISIAVLEAFICGLPSVITRTSQVSYFYNSNAFVMVEPLAKDLKDGIIEMIEKRDNWSLMSNEAQSLIKNHFNWEIIAKKLNEEYKAIIQKK